MKTNSDVETHKPIKRAESLKPLSRDHHHGLLFSWKINTGIKNNVEVSRIKTYADWFYKKYLIPHFEVEEKYVFPILGNENDLIKQVIAEHRRLQRLFESTAAEFQKNSMLIADELTNHIRFEERVLFAEIQKIATAKQLLSIEANHSDEKFIDNLSDPFWD